jgi:hypothetical protein
MMACPAGFKIFHEVLLVSSTIRCIGEEREDGAIVPEIDGFRAPVASNIGLDPGDWRVGQSGLCALEGCSRYVKDRDAAHSASESVGSN